MTLEETAAAAEALRAVLADLPPATPSDRALARRIEGAAIALESVGSVPQTID